MSESGYLADHHIQSANSGTSRQPIDTVQSGGSVINLEESTWGEFTELPDLVRPTLDHQALRESQKTIHGLRMTIGITSKETLAAVMRAAPDPHKGKFSLKVSEFNFKSYSEDKLSAMDAMIDSPYEKARNRSLKMTLYDKRVHPPWYHRYNKILPPDDVERTQPSLEIEHRDYDMAIGKYLGFDHPCLTDPSVSDSAKCDLVRWQVYQRQQRDVAIKENERLRKDMENKKKQPGFGIQNKKLKAKSSSTFMWLTKREREVAQNAIDCLVAYRNKKKFLKVRNKKVLSPGSKWNILRNCTTRKKAIQTEKRWLARHKIYCLFKGVFWANEFCKTVLKRVRYPYHIIKDFEEALTEAKARTNTFFDASRYTVTQKVPSDIIKILSTPWMSRSQDDVEEVVGAFQKVKAFIAMPPLFQSYLAAVGWFISLPDKAVIVRQGQKAENFYIILSGSVKVTRFVGSPIIGEQSETHYIKTYHRSEMFGDECLTRWETRREYTAQAVSNTTLLAIPVLDYHDITVDTDFNAIEPEHITFSRVILDSMDLPITRKAMYITGNVMLHFFTEGSTIVDSVEKSEWVFIVSSGSVLGLSVVEGKGGNVEQDIDALYDKPVRHRGSLISYVPGTFELEVKRARESLTGISRKRSRALIKKASETSPTIPFRPKGTLLELQTRYVIQRTQILWETLSHKEQELVLAKETPEQVLQRMEFVLGSGKRDSRLKRRSHSFDRFELPTSQPRSPATPQQKVNKERYTGTARRLSPRRFNKDNTPVESQPRNSQAKARRSQASSTDSQGEDSTVRYSWRFNQRLAGREKPLATLYDETANNDAPAGAPTDRTASRQMSDKTLGRQTLKPNANNLDTINITRLYNATINNDVGTEGSWSGVSLGEYGSDISREQSRRTVNISPSKTSPFKDTSDKDVHVGTSSLGVPCYQSKREVTIDKSVQSLNNLQSRSTLHEEVSGIDVWVGASSAGMTPQYQSSRETSKFTHERAREKENKSSLNMSGGKRLHSHKSSYQENFKGGKEMQSSNNALDKYVSFSEAQRKRTSSVSSVSNTSRKTQQGKWRASQTSRELLRVGSYPPLVTKKSNARSLQKDKPLAVDSTNKTLSESRKASKSPSPASAGYKTPLLPISDGGDSSSLSSASFKNSPMDESLAAGLDSLTMSRSPSRASTPFFSPVGSISEHSSDSASKSHLLPSKVNKPKIKRKVTGRFTKCCTLGFEFLDMNDGKYRPPAEDYSLMSEGAVIVMVKKAMLLEAYRKRF